MAVQMTAKSAEQLQRAVDAVQDEMDRGTEPTQALVKVSRDMGLPREMIRLVANGHNVAQQTALHKSAESILDRLAEHPLVDGQTAIDAVYGTKQASPAEQHYNTAVSDVYRRPPAVKAASFGTGAIPALKPKATLAPMQGTATGTKLRSALTQAKAAVLAVDAAREQTYAMRDRFLVALNKVATFFRQNPERFLEADYYAQDVLGDAVQPVLEYAAAKLEKYGPVKRASAEPYRGGLVTAHAGVAPYTLLQDVIDIGQAWHTVAADRVDLQDGLRDKVATLLAPFDHYSDRSVLEDHSQPRTKSADLMQGMLGGAVASQLGDGLASTRMGKPTGDLVSDARGNFESAQHANNLRQIDAQVLLHDMLNNDETLAGYPQGDVLSAYNELSEIGPRLTTQSLTMRPLMHRMMAQGGKLDPHDVEQIIGLDSQLARRDLPKAASLWDPSEILA